MMITDIGHAAFRAYDLDKTLAFYALLGIKPAFHLDKPEGGLMLVYLHVGGDRFIEVFPGGKETSANQPGSYMHLCLATDDLPGMVAQLRDAGVTIDHGPSVGLDHNQQAWIHDPDSNPIELMQISIESPQYKIARGTVLE